MVQVPQLRDPVPRELEESIVGVRRGPDHRILDLGIRPPSLPTLQAAESGLPEPPLAKREKGLEQDHHEEDGAERRRRGDDPGFGARGHDVLLTPSARR